MDLYDLALVMTPRVGNQAARHLVEVFGSAEAVFNASLEALISRAELNINVARSIVGRVAFGLAENELRYCRRHGIVIIAATDDRYPRLLLDAVDRPHVLYAVGRTELLNFNLVAFVGTRRMSPYGDRSALQIIRELSEKVDRLAIVSGLAYGVDAASHRAALACHVPTIAVLPNPLPGVTPVQHTDLARHIINDGGLLITEMRSTVRNIGRTFIARNRIIAGISSATVVVESAASGGSISTAKSAHLAGRVVAAVPGRITDAMSVGCNQLIADGVAVPLYSVNRFIDSLKWERREGSDVETNDRVGDFDVSSYSDDQIGLLKCFRFDESIHISTLEELTSLSAGELTAMLMELEIYGAVKSHAGAFYERIIPYAALK